MSSLTLATSSVFTARLPGLKYLAELKCKLRLTVGLCCALCYVTGAAVPSTVLGEASWNAAGASCLVVLVTFPLLVSSHCFPQLPEQNAVSQAKRPALCPVATPCSPWSQHDCLFPGLQNELCSSTPPVSSVCNIHVIVLKTTGERETIM